MYSVEFTAFVWFFSCHALHSFFLFRFFHRTAHSLLIHTEFQSSFSNKSTFRFWIVYVVFYVRTTEEANEKPHLAQHSALTHFYILYVHWNIASCDKNTHFSSVLRHCAHHSMTQKRRHLRLVYCVRCALLLFSSTFFLLFFTCSRMYVVHYLCFVVMPMNLAHTTISSSVDIFMNTLREFNVIIVCIGLGACLAFCFFLLVVLFV